MDRYARVAYFLLLAALAHATDYTLVDVQNVPANGDPARAIVHAVIPDRVAEASCDVLVAGAGMGGIGAALAVARHSLKVCLTEETDWIGGQATAGGVSALDENRFIEIAGGTRSYYQFRQGIRDVYGKPNPGDCYVSALCFEPKIGVQVLNRMLSEKPIRIYPRTQVIALEKGPSGQFVSALAWQFEKRQPIRFQLRFVLDATELGDLLPLAKIPYVVGSEAKADTNEPDAGDKGNPGCVQSFTYPFAVERRDGERHEIAQPDGYQAILARQNFSLTVNYPVENGWKGIVHYKMYGDDPPVPNNMSPGPFFGWRRLLTKPQVALINWPRQDYAAESILDRQPGDLARILQMAKRTSLAFLYWLQHDLGHPELMLRSDEMGTADGLSKYPYVRESRRMIARGRVVEQDIVDESQPGPRARWFPNSIGTGFYMVDIHPCGANERGRMRMPKPFQIPMAALQPRSALNFLAAGKNLGVTHLTNGAFRLHPVEWNIGEAAGTIAALTLALGREPAIQVIQSDLAHAGVPLVWFDDLPVSHSAFAAIHLAALRGIYPLGTDLHASPDAPVTRGEAAVALAVYFGEKVAAPQANRRAIERGWMATDHRNWFHPDLPFFWTDLREDKMPHKLPLQPNAAPRPVSRAAWALRLTADH